MAYLLALASAAVYGAADFLGGLAARRASTIAVVFLSQLAGLVLLGLIFPLLPDARPTAGDLSWGAAAGLAGSAGVALLYRALAVGRMSLVAPTTAVCAVLVPVLAAIALGERPAMRVAAGIGLAIVAIVLVSWNDHPPTTSHQQSGVGLALASGVLIGLFFLALARTGAEAGMWPLVSARGVSVVLFGAIAMTARRGLAVAPAAAWISAGGGALDMLANALYLVAARSGPLSVVVTLSSLYPASTVLLARVVLGERLNAAQGTGIVCALAAVLLIVG